MRTKKDMRSKLKSCATLIGRARDALRRRTSRDPRTVRRGMRMEFLDLELFNVDIRL